MVFSKIHSLLACMLPSPLPGLGGSVVELVANLTGRKL